MAKKQDTQESTLSYESLSALYEASHSLEPSWDIQQALDQIVQAAIKLAKADWGFVVWEPQDGPNLRAYANIAAEAIDEAIAELALGVTQAEMGQAATSNTYIALPLWSPAEVVCTLYLSREADQEPFSKDDMVLVETFATRAAAFIQIAQASEELKSAEAKFASMIAHDLRLPTTAIRGYADLLLKEAVGPLNDMQRQFLTIIHANTDYMATLSYNLSDIVKIEHDRLPLKHQQANIQTVVNKALEKLGPKIEEKEQSLKLDVPALPNVVGDKSRIDQIVNSLIENAHRYTPAEGTITITAQEQDAFVRLTVADTGIGITPEDQKNRLFAKFFRADHPAVQETRGGGNNLYVAKRLVELMGGQMGAESEPDKGSTFWFTLPVAATDEYAET
jgi:signal transduction histidine kinase